MAMDAVHHVEPLIISLLKDDDHFVRAEAARTLAYCNSPLTQQSLRAGIDGSKRSGAGSCRTVLAQTLRDGRMTTAGNFAAALRCRVESADARSTGTLSR